ncbi:uncharacterized protein LOC128951575 [Oppia nitens]|uniref:uncharacterized protein LOC128951575 n=1 Tax=Oppia nitens TaxID=1686743 RepID=UPI0023DA7B2C|nr:uncharacterized protein LOC128951575 [Oppia nitens]
MYLITNLFLIFVLTFWSSIRCDFDEEYERFCKRQPELDSLLMLPDSLIYSFTDFYMFDVYMDDSDNRLAQDMSSAASMKDYLQISVFGNQSTEEYIKSSSMVDGIVEIVTQDRARPSKGPVFYRYTRNSMRSPVKYFELLGNKTAKKVAKRDINFFVRPRFGSIGSNSLGKMFDFKQKLDDYNQIVQQYPFIKDMSADEIRYMTVHYIMINNQKYAMIFSKSDNRQPFVSLYDENGKRLTQFLLNTTVVAASVKGVRRGRRPSSRIFTTFLCFDKNMFALFDITVVTEPEFVISDIKRTSSYKSNQLWIGCPQSLCLTTVIDGYVPIGDTENHYIFSGNYYWKWRSAGGHTPNYNDVFLLKPDFRDMSSAFRDSKSGTVYIIKDNSIRKFDNNSSSGSNDKISDIFQGFDQIFDTIVCTNDTQVCHIFSGDKYFVYNREDRAMRFKLAGQVSFDKLGLPPALDSVFVDENGDKIYIKKNYMFWTEYGILRKRYVQQLFGCGIKDYRNIYSWSEFVADADRESRIVFNERPIDIPKFSNDDKNVDKNNTIYVTESGNSNTSPTQQSASKSADLSDTSQSINVLIIIMTFLLVAPLIIYVCLLLVPVNGGNNSSKSKKFL